MHTFTIKKLNRFSLAAIVALGTLFLPACKKSSPPREGSIYATIAANPNSSLLTAAVNKEGLKSTLDQVGESKLTLFAPDNAAFNAAGINAGNVGSLPDSTVKAILLYHVLPGAVRSSQLPQA